MSSTEKFEACQLDGSNLIKCVTKSLLPKRFTNKRKPVTSSAASHVSMQQHLSLTLEYCVCACVRGTEPVGTSLSSRWWAALWYLLANLHSLLILNTKPMGIKPMLIPIVFGVLCFWITMMTEVLIIASTTRSSCILRLKTAKPFGWLTGGNKVSVLRLTKPSI